MIFFEEQEQLLLAEGYTEVAPDGVFPDWEPPSPKGLCDVCGSRVPFFFYAKDGAFRAFYECGGCQSWDEIGIATAPPEDFGSPNPPQDQEEDELEEMIEEEGFQDFMDSEKDQDEEADFPWKPEERSKEAFR